MGPWPVKACTLTREYFQLQVDWSRASARFEQEITEETEFCLVFNSATTAALFSVAFVRSCSSQLTAQRNEPASHKVSRHTITFD